MFYLLYKNNKIFLAVIICSVINNIIEQVIDETNGISEEEVNSINKKFDNLEVLSFLTIYNCFSKIFSPFAQKFTQKKKMNF